MMNDDEFFARAGSRLAAPAPADAVRAREHARVVHGMVAVERRRLERVTRHRRFAARSFGGVAIAATALFFARTAAHAPGSPGLGPQQVTFEINASDAHRVALVGEFNGWNAQTTPMTRGTGNRWEVTLAVAPGRHTYAFVVNDSTWLADPAAPRAPERWFGDPRSVLVVASVR